MSSKRPVSKFREVPNLTKASIKEKGHDPRFDARSGALNSDLFSKSYGFVWELCKKEKEAVAQEVRKARNTEKRQKLKRLLTRMVRGYIYYIGAI